MTIGQNPKYLDYEDDLHIVVGLSSNKEKSGALLYECKCKSCGEIHLRNAKHLKQKVRARECINTKPHNWSGIAKEDAAIRKNYGISMNEFNALVDYQDGKCAICFKPLENMSRRANIDHDHETGEVRGILCTGCNTGLGHLGDSIKGLERALYYLNNTPYSEFKEN